MILHKARYLLLMPLILYGKMDEDTPVTFAVMEIVEFALDGSPPTLAITSGSPGDSTLTATVSSSTYAFTTNSSQTKKVTGQIDASMPTKTALYVLLAAPSSGSSNGMQQLSTTATNLVTIAAQTVDNNLPITYTLQAQVTAGPLSSFARTVTYTLTDL